MGFSTDWEACFAANTHLSIWPWSDLVSLCHRNCKDLFNNDSSVLELGCGIGANIPFFKFNGFNYHAIEGSRTAVKILHSRHPDLSDRVVCGDFTKGIEFKRQFDLVVDRAALTHNTTSSVKRALELVFSALRPGGVYVGIDWFSTGHSDFQLGNSVDKFTKTDIPGGSFANLGRVHFSSKDHLEDLFSEFSIAYLAEKTRKELVGGSSVHFASFDIVARKPLD